MEPDIEDALEQEVDLPTKMTIEEALEAFDIREFVEGDPDWVLEEVDYENDEEARHGITRRGTYRR